MHRKFFRHVNLNDLIKCQKNGPIFINYSTNYVSPNSWNMINYLLKQDSRKIINYESPNPRKIIHYVLG